MFESLQIASVTCHRINKLGTHEHHCDRSAAAAIFAKGTYFLDNSRMYACMPVFMYVLVCEYVCMYEAAQESALLCVNR